ncbi:uncharacterized protein BDZ99DRAFT_465547 [Mytilinidion resinicola]|uniref:rRNA-processing protein n=1 Tax=Mytilinidion resinicola TaxID=574789 RepID=A0A6A6YFU2_9PEZI|nr:uncharacterized protein BDZ99DRAFT_465547 [Mytilinidion resinicola]KAF2806757.1 hypothetical protein BDZ99DRAFT_465547 [Mytilinidion resinicola]
MSVEAVTAPVEAPVTRPAVQGIRINGKQWHEKRAPLRKNAGLTSYQKRAEDTKILAAIKAKEKEMKDEKEAERLRRAEIIKTRRAAKAEKERYAQMEEKMHKKRVERLKRREKRNKMLKS